MIFYEKIQGEAKNSVINVPDPADWEAIKVILKTRYRPDTEPAELFKRINNIKVNTVSELAQIIQELKYNSNEISIYYKDNNYVDLSNVDTMLVNMIKEITQGVLLDKIYEETDLRKIIVLMRERRFEDSCIRHEYKKNNNFNKNFSRDKNFRNQNRNYSSNSVPFEHNNNNNDSRSNSGQYRQNKQNYSKNNYNQNSNKFYKNYGQHSNNQNSDQSYNNNNKNYSQHRNNQNNRDNNSGQVRRNSRNFHMYYQGSGHSRNNSGQYRH